MFAFNELTKHLVEMTKKITVKQALQDAGLSVRDIEQVLLVGGSTRIPVVQSRLRRILW